MNASIGIRRIGLASMAIALLVILSAGSRSYAQSTPAAAELGKLRILYAGHPGTEREKDFVGFLKKYFDVVQTGNLKTFKEADAEGFDVTLLDWDWNSFYEGPRPKISDSFSRPVVTLGNLGALQCGYWRLKTEHW